MSITIKLPSPHVISVTIQHLGNHEVMMSIYHQVLILSQLRHVRHTLHSNHPHQHAIERPQYIHTQMTLNGWESHVPVNGFHVPHQQVTGKNTPAPQTALKVTQQHDSTQPIATLQDHPRLPVGVKIPLVAHSRLAFLLLLYLLVVKRYSCYRVEHTQVVILV